MKTGAKKALVTVDVEAQLQTFIAKFEAKHQALIRATRKALRKRLPTAHELVYDNYNFFVIGYSPTERPTDSILSLAAGANGVGLAFPYCGARLIDDYGLLQGSGSKNRFIRIPSAEHIDRHDVGALIDQAVALCKPLAPNEKPKLIIRSVSTKQRPRRKPAK